MDYDDWSILKDLVKMLTNKWGNVSTDRFLLIPIRKLKDLILKLWGCKRIFSRLVKRKKFNSTPSIFNSTDDQALYAIKIFSKGNTVVFILAFFKILAII